MADTKKCRECQMDIPKKARRCPHCRAKQGIGLGGLLIILIFVGMIAGVVSSSLEDALEPAPVNTYVPSVQVSNFELGTYKVESEEFQYLDSKQVNLWQSYSDRRLMGKVTQGDVVEVTKHDPANDYCLIAAGEIKGWAACGWLVKVEEN